MNSLKNIFIFEYISSGGFSDEDVPNTLLSEGFGMLSSLVKDFFYLGFKINLLIDNRLILLFQSLMDGLKEEKGITPDEDVQFCYEKIYNSDDMDLKFNEFVKKSEFCMIIAPEFNNILFNYVKRAEEICKKRNGKILNPNSHFIEIFSDKLKTGKFFEHKLITPASYSVEEFLYHVETQFKDPKAKANGTDSTYTYILKPHDGVGCVDTFEMMIGVKSYIEHPDKLLVDVKKALDMITIEYPQENYIVQKKVDGIPLSISAINRKRKLIFFSINMQYIDLEPIMRLNSDFLISRINYIGGFTPYYKIPKKMIKYLKKITSKLCKNYDFNGFFGIDFIFNEFCYSSDDYLNSFSLIEINPRVTTPYIAYSGIFRKMARNFCELFFNGKFLFDSNPLPYSCRFKKIIESNGKTTDSMKIEYFPKHTQANNNTLNAT
jgi:predicted ATP-grasp superfamily ATP-dependent carboligase